MRILKGVDNMGNVENKKELIDSISNQKKSNLKRYKYVIKDENGKLITDYFDAANRMDVESFLSSQGYDIVDITEDKWAKQLGFGNIRKKIMSYK